MERGKNMDQEQPNIHSEHIKQDFYKWFESRGLLSELRAYMRQLMVKALEESNKSGKTSWQHRAPTSPKLQAINLLFVDYLFHEDFYYTVSVFASEAQILNSMPQYSRYLTETVREHRWDPSTLPRFSRQETEDILDTLRLPPSQRDAQQATNLYLAGQESLLACIVRTLVPLQMQSQDSLALDCLGTNSDVNQNNFELTFQLWSQEMKELLLLAGVKLQHILRMQHKWTKTIEEEKIKTRKEVEEENATKQTEWMLEMEQKLREDVMEQMKAEQEHLKERQSRVELKEQSLVNLAEQLNAVHEDISQKLSQLQLQSEQIQQVEAQQKSEREELQRRLSELQLREQHLNRFEDQATTVTLLAEESKVEPIEEEKYLITRDVSIQAIPEGENAGVTISTQTVDEGVTVSTQTLDTVDIDQQTSFDSRPDPEILQQLQVDREKINELQEENLELRAHALQQRHRIDELTNRAASLSNQLEESRIAVAVLSGRESAVITAPATPLTRTNHPVFITPTFGYNTPQRKGAGEESLFAPRPQETTPRPDGRKRPLRFAFSQTPSLTSEDSSPTDEVIQNARTRIQQLEEESAIIQRNYQQFQSRILNTDSVMFPPLGSPRIVNPLMRVRRNHVVSTIPLPHQPYPTLPLNIHNAQSQSVQTQRNEEENEDSSSELYEVNRIENLTNSRRIFSQRNIRHYDRWKQFKKKFQRRDVLDQNRRQLRMYNCNTSSTDDDEADSRNLRRKPETNSFKRDSDSKHNNNKQNQEFHVNKCKQESEHSSDVEGQVIPNYKVEESRPKESFEKMQSVVTETVQTLSPKVELTTSVVEKTEDKIKLELERSVKLIESVKLLLEAQHFNEPVKSTLSNESLDIDSLPRDSQNENESLNDVEHTDNISVLTVQNLNTGINQESKQTVNEENDQIDNPNGSKHTTVLLENGFQVDSNILAINDQSEKNQNYDIVEENVFVSKDDKPTALNVPTLRLISPRQNIIHEDFIAETAITSSDIAEHESVGKATTSLTSGSDILRELNPSNTDSSSSVISTKWEAHSSKSSDFWN